jgi:hypothetical protein
VPRRKAARAGAPGRARDPRRGDLVSKQDPREANSLNAITQEPRSGIPSAHAPGALAVTDGSMFIGSIVTTDGSFFAFDATGVLVGEFATQRQAVRAIPKAGGAS